MTTKYKRSRISLALLLGILGAVSAQADGRSGQGYIMTVYSDMAQGKRILDGAEEKAISRLSRRGDVRVGYLEGQINLCVAYARTKQVQRATDACDLAIEMSLTNAQRMRRTSLFGRHSAQVADTGVAIALTNRGVLHAVAGESEQALAKFEQAMELASTEESAKANLAVLKRTLMTSGS